MLTNQFECPFSFWGRRKGKTTALLTDARSYSYGECDLWVDGIASSLKRWGVRAGESVALFPTKTPSTCLLFFALFRLKAVALPINSYDPLSTLGEKLDQAEARLFIHPEEIAPPPLKQRALTFAEVMGKSPEKGSQEAPHFLEKNQRATYLFTSGTTAEPKIACHSLGNHYYSALGSNRYLNVEAEDRYALSLPLYHVGGVATLFRTFLAGATLSLRKKEREATHLSLVPTQLLRMVEERAPFKGKQILLGGATAPAQLLREARALSLPIRLTYGMTEMSSQVTTLTSPHYFPSLGRPLPYREMKIASDGEILVRGKTLFQGYLRRDGALDLPLNKEGYFCTHDLGSYSSKKGLLLRGRKDRLFISGGENIQPEEIEALLNNLEGIRRARVLPLPDKAFGLRPIAYIESTKQWKAEELKRYLSAHLPKFKIPLLFTRFPENSPARTWKQ